MMFHTSGLKTGSVRLDTVIFGLCCATAALVPSKANAEAAASIARLRRENVVIGVPLPCLKLCLPQPLPPVREPEHLAGYRVGEDQSAGGASIKEIPQPITRPNSARSRPEKTQPRRCFARYLRWRGAHPRAKKDA